MRCFWKEDELDFEIDEHRAEILAKVNGNIYIKALTAEREEYYLFGKKVDGGFEIYNSDGRDVGNAEKQMELDIVYDLLCELWLRTDRPLDIVVKEKIECRLSE